MKIPTGASYAKRQLPLLEDQPTYGWILGIITCGWVKEKLHLCGPYWMSGYDVKDHRIMVGSDGRDVFPWAQVGEFVAM